MLLSGAGLGLIYVYVSNGFACDPFLGVVVSCSVNECPSYARQSAVPL